MKKARYSEDQMVRILREANQSLVSEVAKCHGVSEGAIYQSRKKLFAKRDLEIEVIKEVSQ